jgi:hypothetical protein
MSMHRAYGFGKEYVTRPPASVIAERDQRLQAASEQSAVASLLGDPPRGYSALDHYRARQRAQEARPSISAVPTAAERKALCGISRKVVAKAIALSEENVGGATEQLVQRNRQILRLHQQGFSGGKIGRWLNLTRNTVRGVLHRCKLDAAAQREAEPVAQNAPEVEHNAPPQPRSPPPPNAEAHAKIVAEAMQRANAADKALAHIAAKAWRLIAEGWSWIDIAAELAIPPRQASRLARLTGDRRRTGRARPGNRPPVSGKARTPLRAG